MQRAILPLLLLVGACAEPSPAERGADEERDVAMVRATNAALPPLREVIPEPITFADMEEHEIHGLSCAFAPGTSLGTRVIAREKDAWIKIEGEMLRLAADAGSPELPAQIRAQYDGRAYWLSLEVAGPGEAAGSSGAINYRGTIDLRDRYDRQVYTGTGLAQCGA